MKWIFKRENNDIQVFVLYSDGKECSFSYIDLVKRLYEKETIDSVEYRGDFSEKEKESIELLRQDLNKCAEAQETPDELDSLVDELDLDDLME